MPTVGTFPRADPTRASGSPSDGSAERSSVFDLFPCGTGSALAVDHQVADTEVGYGLVGGPGPGRHPLHPVDCKCQLMTLRRRHTQERPSAAPTATANPSNRHATRAADADATDRITFEVAPAQTFTGSGYDLVTTFDCPHDMGDPLRATRHIRKASHPTAPGSSSNHTQATRSSTTSPSSAVSDAFSPFLCVPNSVSQSGYAHGAHSRGVPALCMHDGEGLMSESAFGRLIRRLQQVTHRRRRGPTGMTGAQRGRTRL